MSTEIAIAAQGAYSSVSAIGAGETLEARRARVSDRSRNTPSQNEPRFAPADDKPELGLPKGLTDGAELKVLGDAPKTAPAPVAHEHVAVAYEKQEARFAPEADRKVEEARLETKGVKAREVPAEPDPSDPPHARAAREIVETSQEHRTDAIEARSEKEQRVLEILRNPEMYGFPKDV